MAESLGNRQLSCLRGGQGARQSAATARAGPMRRHHVCHCRAPSKWRPTTRTLWPGALILLVTEEKEIHMRYRTPTNKVVATIGPRAEDPLMIDPTTVRRSASNGMLGRDMWPVSA